MPAQYEAIRDHLIGRGMERKAAEKEAAIIYNSRRPAGSTPMGPNYEQRAAGKKKKKG